MNIENVSQLNEVPALSASDMIHIIRNNEYALFLSYKEKAKEMKDVYQDISILNTFKSSIDSLMSQLRSVSSSMLTRSEAKSIYVLKDVFESQKNQLLTHDNMNSIISKYVTDDDMKNKAAQARAEAQKLADEMTDFAGAAMVGINQSNAQYQVAPSGE